MTFIKLNNIFLKPPINSVNLYNQNNNFLLMRDNNTKYMNFINDYLKSMSLEYKIAYYLRVPVIGPSPHLFLVGYILFIIILSGVENLIKYFNKKTFDNK